MRRNIWWCVCVPRAVQWDCLVTWHGESSSSNFNTEYQKNSLLATCQPDARVVYLHDAFIHKRDWCSCLIRHGRAVHRVSESIRFNSMNHSQGTNTRTAPRTFVVTRFISFIWCRCNADFFMNLRRALSCGHKRCLTNLPRFTLLLIPFAYLTEAFISNRVKIQDDIVLLIIKWKFIPLHTKIINLIHWPGVFILVLIYN